MKRLSTLLLVAALAGPASAQVPVSDTPVTLDFNDFRGAGFAAEPAAGQLDSDSYDVNGDAGPEANRPATFGDAQTEDVFARGSSVGGVTAEGVYAFETATGDYALGVQPSATFFGPGPAGGSGGYVTVRFQNATSRTLSAVTVQGEVKVLNNGGRSTAFGIGLIPDVIVTGGQEQSRGEPQRVLDDTFTPGAATADGWTTTSFNTTVAGIELSPGENFYVRMFVSDSPNSPTSGDRDEFALDNLSVVAASGVANETEAGGEAAIRALFPNPVAGSASAQLVVTTPRSEHVTVRVYDTLGRLVATAFDGPTGAASETRVALPARLAPGTYLVRVAGETFVSTRPLTVVR